VRRTILPKPFEPSEAGRACVPRCGGGALRRARNGRWKALELRHPPRLEIDPPRHRDRAPLDGKTLRADRLPVDMLVALEERRMVACCRREFLMDLIEGRRMDRVRRSLEIRSARLAKSSRPSKDNPRNRDASPPCIRKVRKIRQAQD